MKYTKNFLLICLCAFVLSGCATRKEVISLPASVQKEIKSTAAYFEPCEKKIRADIETSNISTYTGGGLVFALVDSAIDSYREERADEALVNINNEIQTFNFQEKYSNRLAHILQNTNWLHVHEINHIATINDANLQKIFNKSNVDTVLVSNFIYKLNPQFNVMTGTLYLTLYPTSNRIKKMVSAENPLETPIFKVHVSATKVLPQSGENIQDNAKLWGQNKGYNLRTGLENILDQIFVRLGQILQYPNYLPEE